MITATATEIADLFARLRKVLVGADEVSLDWRPAADTSSLAILAVHTSAAVEQLVGTAAGLSIPRDRDAEFRTAQAGKAALLARLDDVNARSRKWLEDLDPSRLNDKRTLRTGEVTVAYCIVHAAAHMAEHLAHAEITNQLWSQRKG